ncbi:redox-sensing transcriptional repressor [Sanguibacter antarcticus]|uniref:Redox-sensing transcriptional repressor Rex n=1 Tax=Sanguibacter antarcticus TaxID=372484 RepID=A0A2A9E5M4_9MICO|nr:redox-sensing transcriptional repressor [Sanguibacter antarcticus]
MERPEELAREMPSASIERLPTYLRALGDLAARGVVGTSSTELADLAGVRPAQLRKDLSYLGSLGTRGVGYDVVRLRDQVGAALGDAQELRVAIVGVGNLGHALANYSGLVARGFTVAALLDASAAVVGQTVAGLVVEDVAGLHGIVQARGVSIVVIAVPGDRAQEVCDAVVAAGVREILSFAPCALQVPPGVELRSVDVGSELQILAFHSRVRQER